MNRKQRRAAGKQAPGAGTPAAAPGGQAALEDRLRWAVAAHQAGRLDEAARYYQEVLAAAPDHPVALLHLGLARWQAGQQAEGRRLVERCLAVAPRYPEAHYNLAHILRMAGDLDGAESALRTSLALNPKALNTLINLGSLLSERGDHPGALDAARRAVALAPQDPYAHYNLGNSLAATGDPDGAAAAYEAALARQPGFLSAQLNLAKLRHGLGAFDQTEAIYRQVLAQDGTQAEAHTGLAMTLLLTGRLAEGWPHYEHRWQTKGFPEKVPPSSRPRWQGEDLAGRTVVLVGEQGLGDMIQFARFAAPVAARGARVVLRCDRKLTALLATAPGVDTVVAAGDALPEHDVWAPLMSLPLLLGTDLDRIPTDTPYLTVPDGPPLDLPAAEGKRRVGLVWAGSADNPNDARRSAPLEALLPLARRPDLQLFSLQIGAPAEALTRLPSDATIHDLGPATLDFADLARALLQLDLLITVDTATAHLAGALDRPAWVLLPAVPDWRWLLDREASPWYPSLRLFRQPQPGDWPAVLAAVSAALDDPAPRPDA